MSFAGTVGPQQQGKIDQAYGVSMYYEQAKLRAQNPGMSQDQLAFLGNEAGRTAAVATVEKLTGVHIDHFAELNLGRFYELAKVLGGVEVCLNHPVYDTNSGANFRAGYQHMDASQALAFVRQRDGLPNGDPDRTHRQQAFIDSVMHQLRTEGVLSDVTKVGALLSVARRYVITDAGWNLLDSASQMRELTSGNLIFRTLPIKGYAKIDGQDANVVDAAAIQALVQATFNPKPSPPRGARRAAGADRKITVDVFNGGYASGLAQRVSAALKKAGYRVGQVGNAGYRTTTAVRYGTGASSAAAIPSTGPEGGAVAVNKRHSLRELTAGAAWHLHAIIVSLVGSARCLVVGRSVDDGHRLEADLFGDLGQQHILRGKVTLHVGHFVQGRARVVECRL